MRPHPPDGDVLALLVGPGGHTGHRDRLIPERSRGVTAGLLVEAVFHRTLLTAALINMHRDTNLS